MARQSMSAKLKRLEVDVINAEKRTDELYQSLRHALTAADEERKKSADLQKRLDGVNAQLRALERSNERMRGYLDSEAEAEVIRMVIGGVDHKTALLVADEARNVREEPLTRHNRLGTIGRLGS